MKLKLNSIWLFLPSELSTIVAISSATIQHKFDINIMIDMNNMMSSWHPCLFEIQWAPMLVLFVVVVNNLSTEIVAVFYTSTL